MIFDNLNKRLTEEIKADNWPNVEKTLVKAMEILKDYELELDDACLRYKDYKGMGQVFFHIRDGEKNAYLQITWQEMPDKRFNVEMKVT